MASRPYILTETHWLCLKDAIFDLAILPWGATEAHNYHLPYGTDIFEADFLAAEAAKQAWDRGAKPIVLPTIPFGVNTGQSDIYLDINLNPSTQMAILRDVITVLNRQGLRKLLIFNSHGGNNFKALVRELGLEFPEMFLCVSHWFKVLHDPEYIEEKGDHADERETSLMLYFRPDLVLDRNTWGKGKSKNFRIKAFSEGWAWAERRWSEISEDTGVGDPYKSTVEKGERLFREVSAKMGELVYELCKADTDDLYA
ncbi:creatinine amidohydrolase [Muriicola jejuensis]|uniref:Creatininase family protein n=1 Tax=Muriicola jejuensis TaxID=504488 RepID=A0A6P0U7Y2_9FLAO|nr:creatininase family protein [Muriicola jejuensis]NER09245.1 creatininase family protein [Muriicola jejuensis]SMP09991.1 creatinine amidohydrolase [Muriicola jejuensis]